MSWFAGPEGYEVFFNRDERRSRLPARPPERGLARGVRYVAPSDGDHGGAWLMASERGLTLALQNGYTVEDDVARAPAEGFVSRGLLLSELIDCGSTAEVLERLGRRDLRIHRSFLLAAFGADGRGLLARWTHGELTVEHELDPLMPLVSSSFETAEVRRTRRANFVRLRGAWDGAAAELHLAFHRSHWPERGPCSTCMHRPEARTVSFSRVEVGPGEVRFHYVPHPPCRGGPHGPPLSLPRSG